MIKLKNIGLAKVSISEQTTKVLEEDNEFDMAVLEYGYCKNYITKNHLIEEFWDTVQARIGVLQKAGIDVNTIMEQYPKHLEKIRNRPRDKRCNSNKD